MNEFSLSDKMRFGCGEFMTALFISQPVLDVLSYFMQGLSATAITTALRMVLLAVVTLYGFIISERKKVYLAFFSVIAGFWILHMINCFRIGYADPVGDAAEYFKLIQFPLWTLSFITFFRQREELCYSINGVLAVNLCIVLFVIFLSFITGSFVYTYNYPERGMEIGILGWFGVPNAQSAVLTVLVPGALLWAFRKENIWIFSACCVLGFGLLYFTGTRLTFFAGMIIAAAFCVLILWNRSRFVYCIPLVIAFLLFLIFKGASPMEERQGFSEDSNTLYQQKTEKVMGDNIDFEYDGGEIPADILPQLEELYTDVYGVPGPYGIPLLEDMIDEFGLPAVMEIYEYTIKPEILYHSRIRKLKAMDLTWNETDFITKLLGVEYSKSNLNGNIYDPENDFPSLKYYYGYLGAALYLCFIAYFVFASLIAFIKNWRTFLTVEFGTAAMMFAFILAAAQFSGQTLRKPSVCVYFSLAAAIIYVHLYPTVPKPSKLRYYNRRQIVSVKNM